VQDTQSMGSVGPVFWIVCIGLIVFYVLCMWKIFEKAGKPGWAAIVPIYNVVVLLDIVGKPIWWIILYLIPLVSLIVGIIVLANLAKVFGKGTGFAIGLIFLGFIFFPILAFGDATYHKPS